MFAISEPPAGAGAATASYQPTKERNFTADSARGVAALAVCWFHFTHGNPNFLPEGPLKTSGNLGWVGVEVFFVISGYAMLVATEAIGGFAIYGRFIAKRLIRLHPPYLVAILIIVLLDYASNQVPGFGGTNFSFEWPKFLSNLVYAAPFCGHSWYNPVFWTLSVEVQWYLVIAIAGQFLRTPTKATRRSIYLLLLSASFLPGPSFLLFRYLPLFCFGVSVFHYRGKIVSLTEYLISILLCAVASFVLLGSTITVAAIATSAILTFVDIRHPALLWLGSISYSLYLLHVPIGGRIVNLGLRLPRTSLISLVTLMSALTVSVSMAYLLWRFVESPAHRLAQKFRRR